MCGGGSPADRVLPQAVDQHDGEVGMGLQETSICRSFSAGSTEQVA